MIVKKKRTYKKQKGGLKIPEIPEKIYNYFNFIKDLINLCYSEVIYNQNISVLPQKLMNFNTQIKSQVDSFS